MSDDPDLEALLRRSNRRCAILGALGFVEAVVLLAALGGPTGAILGLFFGSPFLVVGLGTARLSLGKLRVLDLRRARAELRLLAWALPLGPFWVPGLRRGLEDPTLLAAVERSDPLAERFDAAMMDALAHVERSFVSMRSVGGAMLLLLLLMAVAIPSMREVHREQAALLALGFLVLGLAHLVLGMLGRGLAAKPTPTKISILRWLAWLVLPLVPFGTMAGLRAIRCCKRISRGRS